MAKETTTHSIYFFHRSKAVGGRIAAVVEAAVQKQYPSLQVVISQEAYDLSGRPLYTMRVTGTGLTQKVIQNVLVFTQGAMSVAKDLVK